MHVNSEYYLVKKYFQCLCACCFPFLRVNIKVYVVKAFKDTEGNRKLLNTGIKTSLKNKNHLGVVIVFLHTVFVKNIK